ncbi:sirohydrochlorin cobaltochelatase [Desulfobacula sp.]|uniref:sirohydrochlorin cobaltochelatase n=1 Tax=Desulfobacula sp. TaxID=2593537 RepID=UPI0025C3246D|nr:sirohydrochlorin cobaltochelatase [Desulfobacula sp.]MBC2703161.1 sirohydrochlorin cobaltochelatase [Desulfobacula sp.]
MKKFKGIVVQPIHLFHMEQYHDLMQYVNAIGDIKTIRDKWNPFNKIVLAKQKGVVLVYVGHGNGLWSTGIYVELQNLRRELYPEVKTFVESVEGYPGLEDVKKRLNHYTPKIDKILLKPLMIVDRNHAADDMAGDEENSWKTILGKAGFDIEIILRGLGSNNQFADLFIANIKNAAKASGVDL